jgi:NADH:ubiquinone oxidoreductase subunit 6 (subunit J)
MIEKIAKLLALRVTSDSRVATIGSIIIYVGGVAFCILACRQMLDFDLSETQIILGLLLIVCATTLMIVVGILLGILGRLSDAKKVN